MLIMYIPLVGNQMVTHFFDEGFGKNNEGFGKMKAQK